MEDKEKPTHSESGDDAAAKSDSSPADVAEESTPTEPSGAVEPVRDEHVQSEPAQSEPAQSKPTHSEPAHPEPAYAEPARPEPEGARPKPKPTPPKPPLPPARDNRRRGGGFSLLIALIALGVAGFALWQMWQMQHVQVDAQVQQRDVLQQRIAELAGDDTQIRNDVENLKKRLADTDGINRSLREELLGVTERARNLEDAVSHLAEQRLSGRDALALNEAEFLLQLADERLALFHDAQAAQSAYRLADSALAAAEDPVFASVRQTISAERQALAAAKPLQTHATLNALERVRNELAELPGKASTNNAEGASAKPLSRLMGLLNEFVRIRHVGTEPADLAAQDVALARSLIAIDLRRAEANLLAGDQAGYSAALDSAREGIKRTFALDSASVKRQLAELDQLAATPLAPALPELGSALKELRNLRNTRALAQPASPSAIKPSAPTSKPAPEPEPVPVLPDADSATPPVHDNDETDA